ncbi:MAG: hypothetical protein FWD60_11065 [Candidatus Azobacteroides sp.]|nr:hypothetical protein [Candidatus Azobacteroides sp.]
MTEKAKKLGNEPVYAIKGNQCMALREYFAGLAMQGVIKSEYLSRGIYINIKNNPDRKAEKIVAKMSVDFADALLEELSNDE